jgi:hypothetical protein
MQKKTETKKKKKGEMKMKYVKTIRNICSGSKTEVIGIVILYRTAVNQPGFPFLGVIFNLVNIG